MYRIRGITRAATCTPSSSSVQKEDDNAIDRGSLGWRWRNPCAQSDVRSPQTCLRGSARLGSAASARYLVLLDDEGCHRASARLLPTTEAHILGSLFSELCNGELPRGETIFEITRFCLDRRQSASERRYARNQLVSAIVDLALSSGITSFTAVADLAWFQQVLAFGWRCRALGLPRAYGSATLVGLRIEIDERTIAEMTRAGVYTAGVGAAAPTPIAAVAA